MHKLLFTFLLCVNSICVYPQLSSLIFRNIDRSSGLPGDEVTALAQDSTGFIWAGTMEGLYRYDGISFKNFAPKDKASNPGTNITKIIVARNGNLWIGTYDGGVSCITPMGQPVVTINSTTEKIMPATANLITDLKEAPDGSVWWTTPDGLFHYSEHLKRTQKFLPDTPVMRGNALNSILFTRQHIWVPGVHGLFFLDTVKRKFYPAGEDASQRAFIAARKDFKTIAFQGNQMWFSNWTPELGVYDRALNNAHILYSGKGSVQPDFNQMANVFHVDGRGNIWIGTGDGLHVASPGNVPGKQMYKSDLRNKFALADNWINAILEDREGNFWIGTRQGISVARPYSQQVVNFSVQRTAPSFEEKQVYSIIEADNNTLLVGTHYEDGIYITDRLFNTRKHVGFNNVKYDWVYRMFNDGARKRIFISTQEGMLLYNKTNGAISIAPDTVFKNFHPVTSIVATSDSIVWMSRYWNKFMRYNLVTGAHKIYDIREMGFKPQVMFLSKDNNNRLWLRAHQAGVLLFDEKTEKITSSLVPNSSNPMLESNVFSFIDLGESYFIGYMTKGFSLYDKKKKTYRHYSKQDGLVSNIVRDAVLSRDGSIWIATRNGISQFFPATGVFRNYNYDNGILHTDFNCITQLSDGRIAAGSTHGLVYLAPDAIGINTTAKPFITDIKIYGSDVAVPKDQDEPLAVKYDENYFSFEFISLHYNTRQQPEYAYMLQGLDKDWVFAGNRKFVSYSGVPGGDYTFRVKARLPNGEWIESDEPVQLHVGTAFFRQWWFYLLLLLAAAALIYAVFKYRLRQALKVERMRSSISSDLHDEVGASLTSISFFSEMAKKLVPAGSKEAEFIKRIGDRSRESIEKMGDIIWSIRPDNDTVSQVMIRMKGYANEIAEAKDINISWEETGPTNSIILNMDQRKNFYLLFKEAVNNAAKHSGCKNLAVNISLIHGKVTMEVKDDGSGFVAGNDKGNGLKNMHTRAHALGGTLKINSQPTGTSVNLNFPVRH